MSLMRHGGMAKIYNYPGAPNEDITVSKPDEKQCLIAAMDQYLDDESIPTKEKNFVCEKLKKHMDNRPLPYVE